MFNACKQQRVFSLIELEKKTVKSKGVKIMKVLFSRENFFIFFAMEIKLSRIFNTALKLNGVSLEVGTVVIVVLQLEAFIFDVV